MHNFEATDEQIKKLARKIHAATVRGKILYPVLSPRSQARYDAYYKNAFYEPLPPSAKGKGKKLRIAILTRNVRK